MRRHTHLALASVAAALLLAACGGGGGGDAPADPLVPGTGVPQSATRSAMDAFAFVMSLLPLGENSEPVSLGDAVLGTSETDEPRSL